MINLDISRIIDILWWLLASASCPLSSDRNTYLLVKTWLIDCLDFMAYQPL